MLFSHIFLGGVFPCSRCMVVILSIFCWEIFVFVEPWLVERQRLVRILLRLWQQMWNLLERICGFSLMFKFLVVWLPSTYQGAICWRICAEYLAVYVLCIFFRSMGISKLPYESVITPSVSKPRILASHISWNSLKFLVSLDGAWILDNDSM